MPDREKKPTRYVELNALGKVVYLSGAAARFTVHALEALIDRTTDMVVEAEHAFKRELDPDVEDAKILEEVDRAS